jgi:hypothetical protein
MRAQYLERVLVGAVISDVYRENITTPRIAFDQETKSSKTVISTYCIIQLLQRLGVFWYHLGINIFSL